MEGSGKRKKILFLGDSPSGHSGLGRIHRDIAMLTNAHLGKVYDVATIGLGNPPSKQLPWMQYPAGNVQDWVVEGLPYAWHDHVGDEEGILFCIWDLSRLLWLAYPEQCPIPAVGQFLLNAKMKKWVYPAVDGAGPDGGLPSLLRDAATKFDRVLNYTQFSREITGYPDVCTHGIDIRTFYRRPDARSILAQFNTTLEPDEKLIGIVATNQPRKDWGLAFETLKILKEKGVKARVWIHTDAFNRHWDLQMLYQDFQLHPEIKCFLTPFGLNDDAIATLYSACDVTLGIGPEGFGYPIAESLCCGTPCITGRYGGQRDFVPEDMQVSVFEDDYGNQAFRHEGVYGIKRPVYSADHFARKIVEVFGGLIKAPKPICSWKDVWPSWESWFREGLK